MDHDPRVVRGFAAVAPDVRLVLARGLETRAARRGRADHRRPRGDGCAPQRRMACIGDRMATRTRDDLLSAASINRGEKSDWTIPRLTVHCKVQSMVPAGARRAVGVMQVTLAPYCRV
jgi:hypothetical protein